MAITPLWTPASSEGNPVKTCLAMTHGWNRHPRLCSGKEIDMSNGYRLKYTYFYMVDIFDVHYYIHTSYLWILYSRTSTFWGHKSSPWFNLYRKDFFVSNLNTRQQSRFGHFGMDQKYQAFMILDDTCTSHVPKCIFCIGQGLQCHLV